MVGIRWTTRNKGTGGEIASVEVEVERLLERYKNALWLHQKKQYEKAKDIYEEILENDTVKEESDEISHNLTITSSPLLLLRYLVLKNYAQLLEETGGPPDTTLEYYLDALDTDDNDPSLWYSAGKLALKCNNLRIARWAFEHGASAMASHEDHDELAGEHRKTVDSINASSLEDTIALALKQNKLTPAQWRCLEGLCRVLVDIGDDRTCRSFIHIINAHYPGWPLRAKLEEDLKTVKISNAEKKEPETIPIHLKRLDLSLLADTLLNAYKKRLKCISKLEPAWALDEDDDDPDYAADKQYLGQPVYIALNVQNTSNDDETDKPNEEDTYMEDTGSGNEKRDADDNQGEGAQIREMEKTGESAEESSTQEYDTPPATLDHDVSMGEEWSNLSAAEEKEEKAPSVTSPHERTDDLSIRKTSGDDDGDEISEPEKRAIPTTEIMDVDTQEVQISTAGTDRPAQADTAAEPSQTEGMSDATGSLATAQDSSMPTDTEATGADDETKNKDENIRSPLKRQRSEHDSDDEEGEGEEETEDKRSTLRTSKRKREQIENEESFRKKMHDEELDLHRKVQKVFERLATTDYFCREPSSWHLSAGGKISKDDCKTFLEWFDSKVMNLGRSSTWDFNAPRYRTLETTSSDEKQVHKHDFFQYSSREAHTTLPDAGVAELVEHLNANKAGLADCLLQVASRLIEMDVEHGLSAELGDSMLDIILQLQEGLQDVFMDLPVQSALRVCERMIDRHIQTVLDNRGSHVSLKKKPKQNASLVRDSDDQCTWWLALYERRLTEGAADRILPGHEADKSAQNADKVPGKDDMYLGHELKLRYWFLKGKLAICADKAEEALAWYKRCHSYLQKHAVSIETHCLYDGTICLETTEEKMRALEIGKRMADVQRELNKKSFDTVIPEIKSILSMEERVDPSERSELLSLLAKAYTESDQPAQAWHCHIIRLENIVRDLVTFGVNQFQNSTVCDKGSDIEFFRYLYQINVVLQELVQLLLEENMVWPTEIRQEHIDALAIILQMTIYYLYRHPDFIHLVNNFSNPNMDTHTPSNTTRNSAFNTIVAHAWTLMTQLGAHVIDLKGNELPELLSSLHDDLGEREICGTSKGILLKEILRFLTRSNAVQHRRGIYQCYHCLYGVHLAAESDYIEEHNANHERLNKKAAESLFDLVLDHVIERLAQSTPLRQDLKDIIDMVSNLFGPLPNLDGIVTNRKMIKDYLSKPIMPNRTVSEIFKHAAMYTRSVQDKKISSVYRNIFWIQGKSLRLQIKNRTKPNSEKTLNDLDDAMNLFTNHLILNPDDAKAWYELGLSSMQVAEEELQWSATNILSQRTRIIACQKRAYHALCRACHLIKIHPFPVNMHDMFATLGHLIYSMACPPMKMIAFTSRQPMLCMNAQKQLVDVMPKPVTAEFAYRMALSMFSVAIKQKQSSPDIWRSFYMIGKCSKKLNRPPEEVLMWYRKAIDFAKSKAGQGSVNDRLFPPTYKLCSTLANYLKNRKIDSKTVIRLLGDGKPAEGEHQDGFDYILQHLGQIKQEDKGKWHHRPIYHYAWLLYHIYNDANRAKAELMQLFALKSTTRSHINIWKPEYERPGKHFEYVHKYTLFLIELAEATSDLDTLKLLKDKLPRAEPVLLRSDEVSKLAREAYTRVQQQKEQAASAATAAAPSPSVPGSEVITL
ncbi:hypothetical protein BCR43DRAFT_490797 [Syncephalastrum racemosum]|uniref:Histone transcription regulator 3 homolog n=1 Tax=Syncephalastrum racemosum TaxID=13706 RepID=A0A1X2HGK6_SYNRA|nr:hypothetical protein BCR43DRAFT_490797 [Syncephalastrum racemosum]